MYSKGFIKKPSACWQSQK